MGCDAAGNRYYENRVDYPFGQHRWVEPGDIHNFDATSIPPEWHGWMVSQNDVPPSQEQEYIDEKKKHILPMCQSHAPDDHHVGHQEELYNFHHLHNLTQVRSRGYRIGNPIVGLPPGVKDSFYTQPGSPYNEASQKKKVVIGDLDEDKGGGRPYTNEKWRERLMTAKEKNALAQKIAEEQKRLVAQEAQVQAMRLKALKRRGAGTVVGPIN